MLIRGTVNNFYSEKLDNIFQHDRILSIEFDISNNIHTLNWVPTEIFLTEKLSISSIWSSNFRRHDRHHNLPTIKH